MVRDGLKSFEIGEESGTGAAIEQGVEIFFLGRVFSRKKANGIFLKQLEKIPGPEPEEPLYSGKIQDFTGVRNWIQDSRFQIRKISSVPGVDEKF